MTRASWVASLLFVAACANGTGNPSGEDPFGSAGAGVTPPATPMTSGPPQVMKPATGTGGAGGSSGGIVTAPTPMAGSAAPDVMMKPPVTMPMAGTGAPPATAGTGSVMMMPPAMTSPKDPTVPEVKGECPAFKNGTITFMGLGGIQIVAGTKPSSPTAPMVFYWHGTGSFSGEFATMAGAVQQGVVKEGGVLVSFQDTTGGDLLSGTAIFGKGDFDITDQLAACAVANGNVDPHRIFATGCSAGGLFSGAMAAARSNYIAAAAPNSGGWTAPVMFQNMHTPALMTIHGAPGADVVIIDFSNSSATADKAFKMRGGFVINCNHGGGHCGGGGLAPDIWEFFKAHPYGVDPEPWTSLPSGFNSACKIYDGS